MAWETISTDALSPNFGNIQTKLDRGQLGTVLVGVKVFHWMSLALYIWCLKNKWEKIGEYNWYDMMYCKIKLQWQIKKYKKYFIQALTLKYNT